MRRPRFRLAQSMLASIVIVGPSGCLLPYYVYRRQEAERPPPAPQSPTYHRTELRPQEPLVATGTIHALNVAPIVPPPRSWSPPTPIVWTLPNGLRAYFVPLEGQQTVELRLVNRRAGENDLSVTPGLATLTARMVLQTEGRPTQTSESLRPSEQAMRVRLRISTDSVEFATSTTANEFPQVVLGFAHALQHPEWDENQFAVTRRRQIEERREQRHGNADTLPQFAYEQLFGPRHRLGFSRLGGEDTLARCAVQNAQEFFAQRYVPSNTAVLVIGPPTLGTQENVRDTVVRAFGSWTGGAATPTPPEGVLPPPSDDRIHFVPTSREPLTKVILMYPLPAAGASEDLRTAMLHTILGGMSTSRIATSIRIQSGYSYAQMSSIDSSLIGSTLAIAMDVRPESVSSAIQRALAEVQRLRATPPAVAELERARRVLTTQLLTRFQNVDRLANYTADLFVYDRPLTTFSQVFSDTANITADDVSETARLYLTDRRMHVVVAGDPEQTNTDALSRLGLGRVRLHRQNAQ